MTHRIIPRVDVLGKSNAPYGYKGISRDFDKLLRRKSEVIGLGTMRVAKAARVLDGLGVKNPMEGDNIVSILNDRDNDITIRGFDIPLHEGSFVLDGGRYKDIVSNWDLYSMGLAIESNYYDGRVILFMPQIYEPGAQQQRPYSMYLEGDVPGNDAREVASRIIRMENAYLDALEPMARHYRAH